MTPSELSRVLDKHFKSNNGAHWCFEIHRGFVYMNQSEFRCLKMDRVAFYILRTYRQFRCVVYPGLAFTRETLKRKGYKFRVESEQREL